MLGFEASERSRVELRVASGYSALGWVARVPMSLSICSVSSIQRYYTLQCRPKASSYPQSGTLMLGFEASVSSGVELRVASGCDALG